jgi:hypothetical protein
LAAQIVLGVLIALATTGVLVLHEAADVSPTPIHALGGVMGLEGQPVSPAAQTLPEPYRSHALQSISAGWRLIKPPRVQVDLVSRFAHLLWSGLWLGGLVVAMVYPAVPLRRFLAYSWLWLGVQLLSGVVQMAVATPFALSPYLWNLEALHHIRFGWTYTVLMSIKQGLVLGVVAVTGLLTWRSRVAVHPGEVSKAVMSRWFHAANLALGLAIAWVMVMLLLVHEGVDHAL